MNNRLFMAIIAYGILVYNDGQFIGTSFGLAVSLVTTFIEVSIAAFIARRWGRS